MLSHLFVKFLNALLFFFRELTPVVTGLFPDFTFLLVQLMTRPFLHLNDVLKVKLKLRHVPVDLKVQKHVPITVVFGIKETVLDINDGHVTIVDLGECLIKRIKIIKRERRPENVR